MTSLGHEDVAYASYVYEYSTGHFSGALSNSKTALEVMDRLLPENHLLMASAKRVCALILEVQLLQYTQRELSALARSDIGDWKRDEI